MLSRNKKPNQSRSAAEHNIAVLLRIRPDAELANGCQSVFIGTDQPNKIRFKADKFDRTYTCDNVFSEGQAQGTVYKAVQHIVQDFLRGCNGTIFAYGQTSSGKTYTMQGIVENNAEQGIIPRAISDIFQHFQAAQIEEEQVVVKVSYYEVYNEKPQDLLKRKGGGEAALKLQQDSKGTFYVKGLVEKHVSSAADAIKLMSQGNQLRAVAATKMNEQSSRSHAIFQVQLVQKNEETKTELSSKLFLVDLAGSENLSKSGSSNAKETGLINCSLFYLGQVIESLAKKKPAVNYIYNNSVLTRILKQSLGGNSRTAILFCCSPAPSNAKETWITLEYGERAKTIRNKVVINEELTNEKLKELVQTLEKENARLWSLKANSGGSFDASSLPELSNGGLAEQERRELDEHLASLAQELVLKDGQLVRQMEVIDELNKELLGKELALLASDDLLEEAKKKNAQSKEDTQTALGCLAKKYQTELAKLQKENGQIAEELGKVRRNCDGLEEELEKKGEEIGKMALALEKAKAQGQEKEEANGQLTREVKNCLQKLQTTQKDCGKLSGENEKLKVDKSQMGEELALSTAQIGKLEAQIAKMDGLLTEKNEIGSKEELARARMARQIEELQMALEGANANLKEANEEGTSKDKQVAEFERTILKLTKTNKSVEGNCQRTQEQYNRLIEELERTRGELGQVETNLEEARDKLQLAERKAELLSEDCATLKSLKEQSQHHYQQQICQLEKAIAECQARLETRNSQIAFLEQQLEYARKECVRLEAGMESEKKLLTAENGKCRQENGQLREEAERNAKTLEALRKEAEERKARIGQLEVQMKEAGQEMQKVRHDLEAYKMEAGAQFRAHVESIESLEEERGTLRRELADSEKCVAQKEEENGTLLGQVEQLREERAKAEEQLKAILGLARSRELAKMEINGIDENCQSGMRRLLEMKRQLLEYFEKIVQICDGMGQNGGEEAGQVENSEEEEKENNLGDFSFENVHQNDNSTISLDTSISMSLALQRFIYDRDVGAEKARNAKLSQQIGQLQEEISRMAESRRERVEKLKTEKRKLAEQLNRANNALLLKDSQSQTASSARSSANRTSRSASTRTQPVQRLFYP